jgi:hypothetical protein
MQAKMIRLVNENNIYPYTVDQFRTDEPHLSISNFPHETELESYRNEHPPILVYPVKNTEMPEYNHSTHYIKEGDPILVDGEWNQTWILLELPPPPDWKTFKTVVMENPVLNEAIANAIPLVTSAALAIPAALMKAEEGKLDDLEKCWDDIRAVSPVENEVINELIQLATLCNLPASFIDILT